MERTPLIGGWENFYVIVGSSAAALTGLQFVVITLIDADKSARAGTAEVGAFGTPTVVHFCAALLISTILSAPWHDASSVASALVICGVSGVVYAALVIRRAARATGYKPVLEDWIWHATLPLLAYGTLLVAALALPHRTASSLFAVAAAALLLLLVGIHNAWDTVTYLAIDRARARENRDRPR